MKKQKNKVIFFKVFLLRNLLKTENILQLLQILGQSLNSILVLKEMVKFLIKILGLHGKFIFN